MRTLTLPAALTAEIRLIASTQLEVKYKLRNETDGDLCVFDKMFHTKPTGERLMDDGLAYVLFDDATSLHLTRSVVPIPATLKVEAPEVPYVTILRAGATIEGRVLLPVPVLERHPYLEPSTASNTKPRMCNQVVFSIAVMQRAPDIVLRELPKVGKGVFAVDYGPAAARQQLLKTPPLRIQITALAVEPRPAWAK